MTTELIKEQYLTLVRGLLYSCPDILKTFEHWFQAGEYRRAYLVIQDATQSLDLRLSKEQQKVDEDFYWVFVN